MSKRLRKLSKLNLEDILISGENEAILKELAKSCLDCVLISDENDKTAIKELEAMIREDSINSLLIEENFDLIILESFDPILEDIDPLRITHEFYPKPKNKPITTNQNWYI